MIKKSQFIHLPWLIIRPVSCTIVSGEGVNGECVTKVEGEGTRYCVMVSG